MREALNAWRILRAERSTRGAATGSAAPGGSKASPPHPSTTGEWLVGIIAAFILAGACVKLAVIFADWLA